MMMPPYAAAAYATICRHYTPYAPLFRFILADAYAAACIYFMPPLFTLTLFH